MDNMNSPESARYYAEGQTKYHRSLNRAQLADLLSLITGRNNDLVQFDHVIKELRAHQQIDAGTQWVPLDHIVGSVGRYKDFTRTFLPRTNIGRERWARVNAAVNSMTGVPPIELFKIGDVYFVRDGNHRVSVGRANGNTHIEAYVTEIPTDIPFSVSDFERDQWLIKIERVEFLRKTNLDVLRPDHDLQLTEPGRYKLLHDHIEVHRYLRNMDLDHEGAAHRLSWAEGVGSWYDTIYMPIVDAIREHDLLRHFPNRTEADLYLWISYHREALAEHYGLATLGPHEAVHTFVEAYGERPLEQQWKDVRLNFLHALKLAKIPLGMSEEAFRSLRERHDAGELSLGEAERLRERV
ncbi:MAG: hypothetical protein AAF639_01975 [Chloroflexota bacterium]